VKDGFKMQLDASFVAMKGYSAGLKSCLAGLVLVCDMIVSAFMTGGEMIELMKLTGGYRTVEEMVKDCEKPGGMPASRLRNIEEGLKGVFV
jgi:hypothetical protein